MIIQKGFNEKELHKIAKASGNKQIVKDVSYMRTCLYHNAKQPCAEILGEYAFWIGYQNKDHFRLVGIGVIKDMQGKGYGKFMLHRAMKFAHELGFSKMRTRTFSGVDFYQKWWGAKIIGTADEDFLMEMDV